MSTRTAAGAIAWTLGLVAAPIGDYLYKYQLPADFLRLMEVNGEAIAETRPWVTHGEGPTSVREEYSEEITERFTPRDFRFTKS